MVGWDRRQDLRNMSDRANPTRNRARCCRAGSVLKPRGRGYRRGKDIVVEFSIYLPLRLTTLIPTVNTRHVVPRHSYQPRRVGGLRERCNAYTRPLRIEAYH